MTAELQSPSPTEGADAVPCNLCGGRDVRELYPAKVDQSNGHHSATEIYACTSNAYGLCGPIVRCQKCRLVFQSPVPPPSEIIHAYEEVVDERYEQERIGRVHTFGRDLAELQRYMAPGRVLDVGCHIGLFLEIAQEKGWDAWGIEPSNWAAERARTRGLQVIHGPLDEADLQPQSFDAVTMWDVIEHLSDPLGALKQCHELLKPGGVIAVCTMDVEALFPRVTRRRWPWYMQMHLIYFSKRTLAAMLDAAGYDVLGTAPHKRVVRADYLASRLAGYFPPAARLAESALDSFRLGDKLITVDLGDLFLMFARKREA
jgi:2-polyprenyl-3-methyl-5-hydroxy-6-metoxy-1,4-benzoquinol methylase